MFDVVLLGLEECTGIAVDRDRCDFVAHTVVFASRLTGIEFPGDFGGHIQSIRDLPEHRMTIVQKRGRRGGDEKLGPIGVRTRIGHGENARRAMAKIGVKFVGKLVTRTAPPRFGGITTLEHKAIDHPVECHIVVVTAASKIQEIRAGNRCLGSIERCLNVTCGRVDCDFDVRHGSQKTHSAAFGNPSGTASSSTSPH